MAAVKGKANHEDKGNDASSHTGTSNFPGKFVETAKESKCRHSNKQ